MTSSAQGKRDAAAEAYYQDQMEKGELNSRHMDTLDQAFKTGFDAGYSLARNEANVLVDALKHCKSQWEATSPAYKHLTSWQIARDALAAYEKGDV